MAIIQLSALRAALGPGQRLLGIDPGTKTIGIALSDVRLVIASPFGSVKRGKIAANAAEIGAIIRRQGVGGLVVGLPLEMDGTMGTAAQAARDWTHALTAALKIDAALWDERLSSAVVNRFLIKEAHASRAKRAEKVDSMAAAYMLQGALDATL